MSVFSLVPKLITACPDWRLSGNQIFGTDCTRVQTVAMVNLADELSYWPDGNAKLWTTGQPPSMWHAHE